MRKPMRACGFKANAGGGGGVRVRKVRVRKGRVFVITQAIVIGVSDR